jgi:hypothetical protein
MVTSPTYDLDSIDSAIDHVIVHGAENNGATTYYTLVFGAAGLPSPQNLHHGGDPIWSPPSWRRFINAVQNATYRLLTLSSSTSPALEWDNLAAATSGSTTSPIPSMLGLR